MQKLNLFPFIKSKNDVLKQLTGVDTIVTHPGKAHKDDVLACAVMSIMVHSVNGTVPAVYRRDPTKEDMGSRNTVVIDAGMAHEPQMLNFDHHQLGSPDECALTLVLDWLGILSDAYAALPWLQLLCIIDCDGPTKGAEHIGIHPSKLSTIADPLGACMLSLFNCDEHEEESSLTMGGGNSILLKLGYHIVTSVVKFSDELKHIGEHSNDVFTAGSVRGLVCLEKFWYATMARYKEILEEDGRGTIAFCISTDDRGEGLSLYRFNDDPRVDFNGLRGNPNVRFVHANGFLAKTVANVGVTEALTLVEDSLTPNTFIGQ